MSPNPRVTFSMLHFRLDAASVLGSREGDGVTEEEPDELHVNQMRAR